MSVYKALFYLIVIAFMFGVYGLIPHSNRFTLVQQFSILTSITNQALTLLTFYNLVAVLLGYKTSTWFHQVVFQVSFNVVLAYWPLKIFAPGLLMNDQVKDEVPFWPDLWVHGGMFLLQLFEAFSLRETKFSCSAAIFTQVFMLSYLAYIQVLERIFSITLYPLTKPDNLLIFLAALPCSVIATQLGAVIYSRAGSKYKTI